MSPSPVRSISALDSTETTCAAFLEMLRSRYPRTTISSPPGIETSTSSSTGAAASAGVSAGAASALACSACSAAASCAINMDGETSADVKSNSLIASTGFNIVIPFYKFEKRVRCMPAWPHLTRYYPPAINMLAVRCRDRLRLCPVQRLHCCRSSLHTKCRWRHGQHRHRLLHQSKMRCCWR